jgi:hypothetical protein
VIVGIGHSSSDHQLRIDKALQSKARHAKPGRLREPRTDPSQPRQLPAKSGSFLGKPRRKCSLGSAELRGITGMRRRRCVSIAGESCSPKMPR